MRVGSSPDEERQVLLDGESTAFSTGDAHSLEDHLDAGAFGATVHQRPVAKSMTFMGNIPGLDNIIHKRLTAEEHQFRAA